MRDTNYVILGKQFQGVSRDFSDILRTLTSTKHWLQHLKDFNRPFVHCRVVKAEGLFEAFYLFIVFFYMRLLN